jgi:hypothetical protein
MQLSRVLSFRRHAAAPITIGALALLVPAPSAHGQHGEKARPGLTGHSEQGHTTGDTKPPPDALPSFLVRPLACGLGRAQTTAGLTHDPGVGLYVALYDDNVLVTIDDEGTISTFADLDPLAPDGHPQAPTLDVLGTYEGALLFHEAGSNALCQVGSDGTPSVLVDPSDASASMTAGLCDPYGAFGGRMLLTDRSGSLRAVEADGTLTLLAKRVGHVGHALAYGAGGDFGNAVYVTDVGRRRILRVDASHPAGATAPVWLDLSDTPIVPSSIAISAAGPFGTDVMYVADAGLGRVIMLGADGSFQGEFVTGLMGEPSIELPRDGVFAGSMVITSGGSIWVIEPAAARADIDGSGVVDGHDLRRLLIDWGTCGKTGECPADIDRDGHVDGEDLMILILEW